MLDQGNVLMDIISDVVVLRDKVACHVLHIKVLSHNQMSDVSDQESNDHSYYNKGDWLCLQKWERLHNQERSTQHRIHVLNWPHQFSNDSLGRKGAFVSPKALNQSTIDAALEKHLHILKCMTL